MICDPISLGAAAVSAAGGLVSGISQQNQVNAQNRANQMAAEASRKARMAELERQKGFEKEAVATWDKSLEGLAPEDQAGRQEEAVRNFLTEFDAREDPATAGQFLSGQRLAGEEARGEIARRTAEASAEARRRVEALARLSSYGTAESGNRAILGDGSNQLQLLNGLRRGSLGVSQQEQSIPAATVPAGSGQMVGTALQGLGSVMAGVNFSGGAPGALPSSPRLGFASPGQRA